MVRHKIESLMKAEKSSGVLPFFLYAASLVYGFVTTSRRLLYKKGVLKSRSLPCVVISVGNITAGGSGKTPMAVYLQRLFLKAGFRPAIVSRGYRGSFEQKGGIVSDGFHILASPSEAGDEPYMMAVKTGSPVICGKDRYRAGLEAIRLGADVIILDDGFQHLSLKRDINLLLADFDKPFGNGFLIPRGLMREPCSAVYDADAVIMTRSPVHALKQKPVDSLPVFYSHHRQYASRQPKQELNSIDVLVVSGIADNYAFLKSIADSGFNIKNSMFFEDHHSYSAADIKNIENEAKISAVTMTVTTEKDFVKIQGYLKDDSAWLVFGVDIDFGHFKNDFEHWLLTCLKKKNQMKL